MASASAGANARPGRGFVGPPDLHGVTGGPDGVDLEPGGARPPGMDSLAPSPPPGFVARSHRQSWRVPHARADVWAWLNRPATFTDGQVPPWRVEFVAPDGRAGGFETGTWTAHHGPGLLFAGRLAEVVGPAPGADGLP